MHAHTLLPCQPAVDAFAIDIDMNRCADEHTAFRCLRFFIERTHQCRATGHSNHVNSELDASPDITNTNRMTRVVKRFDRKLENVSELKLKDIG